MATATNKTAASKATASKATASKNSASKATKKSASKKSASKATTQSASEKSTKPPASKKSMSKTTKQPVSKKSASKKSTKQPASKKSTSKMTTQSASKKSASKKPAKKPASKSATKKSSSTRTESAEQRGARASAAAGRVISWLRRYASLPDLPAGASPAALAAVEAAIGTTLPPGLAAWWRLHDGGVPIFEYAGMSCVESLRRRKGLEMLRLGGTFDDHELFEQDAPRFAAVKWHPGWIPLAEDGCGNLYVVDTAPGPAGQVGQVLRWEVRGGAFAASSVLLADVLERYADALTSGKFVFDPQSLNFDGPYLDLLAP